MERAALAPKRVWYYKIVILWLCDRPLVRLYMCHLITPTALGYRCCCYSSLFTCKLKPRG